MTAVNRIVKKAISLVLLAVFLTVLFVSMALARRDEIIYPSNVLIGGISIANLNQAEARAKIQKDIGAKWRNTLQLKINDNNAVYNIPLSELNIKYNLDASLKKADQFINESSGFDFSLHHILIRCTETNIMPVLDINESILYNRLAALKKKLDKPAINARVLYTQGCLEYVEHKSGLAIDLDASFMRIKAALEKGSLGPVRLVTKKLYPQVKIEDIKSITDLIGVSTIALPAGQNEKELERFQTALNGIIVMPDDHFSWQISVDKQIRESNNNSPILPQITEGIVNACQSARLNIICRKPGGLEFSNNLGKPVMLSLVEDGNDFVVKIFGCQTEAGKVISLIKEQSVISPEDIIEVDKKLKPGERKVIEGKAGKIVRTYRLVKINGVKTEKNLLSEEVIPAVNTVVKVAPDTVFK